MVGLGACDRAVRNGGGVSAMPRVLISDKLSPAAVAIFRERGIEADVKTGLTPAELRKLDEHVGSPTNRGDDLFFSSPEAVAAATIGNLVTSVATLYGAGARNFLLPNLPDLGITPLALADPTNAWLATTLSEGFNAGLSQAYAGLQWTLNDPTLSLITFDVMARQRAVAFNPAAFGFSNVTTPCYAGAPGGPGDPVAALCTDATGYFYWDRLHPTTAAHALLGSQMLAAVPEPATMLLMAAGTLALLGLSARRRQRGNTQA